MLKYITQLRITSTWQKASASGGWRWLYLKKTLWYLRAANDWTHRNGRKTQHFNYYKLWYLFFYFGIFHSKSVIMLVLCLVLSKSHFVNFYSVFLKWTILIIVKIIFLLNFSGYQHHNFPLKVCNTDCIMRGFEKKFLKQFFFCDLRVNYSVNI